MKKMFLGMLTAGLVMSCSLSALAAISTREAIDIARREVPATAENYGVKLDNGVYEVKFRDNSRYTKYEIELNQDTGKVLEMEIKGSNSVKSTLLQKTEAEIRDIVLAEYPDAQNLFIKVDRDNQYYEYEAEFNTAKYWKVELDISPVTGVIGKRDLKYR